MNRLEAYLQTIRRAYPDFEIGSVELIDKGQNSDVLVVNGETIFRFPRYAPGVKRLEIETTILIGIQDYVPLDIPAPEFVHLEAQAVGQAFIGYRLIAGEPLWRETFRAIRDEATLETLAAQLAGFLKSLHSVPVDTAIACELPRADTSEEWADIYARMKEKLFPFMRPDARQWTARHFETFLDDASHFEYQPVLTHSDFGTSNILFDAQSGRIQGIIDFGSSGLGDPAGDFAGLLSSYEEPFLRRCWATYPEIGSFWDRIHFYRGTFALLEALFGIENDDQRAFEAGIAEYV